MTLIAHLPPESALATRSRDGAPAWSLEAHLLDNVRMSLVGTEKRPAKPAPGRPVADKTTDPAHIARADRARRREAARQARLAAKAAEEVDR